MNPVIGTLTSEAMEFQLVGSQTKLGVYENVIEVLVNVIESESDCQVAVSIPAREDSKITSADLRW